MFTTGSKWFLGLGLVAFVLAAAYGWTTGGDGLGPLTVGYYGGIGDTLGYTMLVSIAVCAFFLGLLAVALRDADSSALAQVAGTEAAPTEPRPSHVSYWPTVAAFGLALVALGLVISNVLFFVGLIVLLAAGVEWMVLAFADKATADPETNLLVRARMIRPFEVPLAAVLLGGGTIAALSRVFLAVSEHGAIIAATVAGFIVFAIGTLLATRPKLSSNLIAGLLVVAALGVVSAGVVSAAHGERDIEKPATPAEPKVETETKTGVHTPTASDNGLHAHIPAGTEHASTTTTEATG
jgi:hypothetical protein